MHLITAFVNASIGHSWRAVFYQCINLRLSMSSSSTAHLQTAILAYHLYLWSCGFGRRCSCSSSVTRHQRHRRQESSDTSLRSVTEEDYRAGLLRYEYVLFTLQYMPYCIYFNISYLYIISLILLNCRSICLCFVCYLCPDRREGDNKRCFCLSVRLSVCPSVVYIANNSRT